MACASSCKTPGEHRSYGACLRSQTLGTLYVNRAMSAEDVKFNNREIANYRQAVAQGMDPDGTTTAAVQKAVRWSDKHNLPYSPEAVRAVDTQTLLS